MRKFILLSVAMAAWMIPSLVFGQTAAQQASKDTADTEQAENLIKRDTCNGWRDASDAALLEAVTARANCTDPVALFLGDEAMAEGDIQRDAAFANRGIGLDRRGIAMLNGEFRGYLTGNDLWVNHADYAAAADEYDWSVPRFNSSDPHFDLGTDQFFSSVHHYNSATTHYTLGSGGGQGGGGGFVSIQERHTVPVPPPPIRREVLVDADATPEATESAVTKETKVTCRGRRGILRRAFRRAFRRVFRRC